MSCTVVKNPGWCQKPKAAGVPMLHLCSLLKSTLKHLSFRSFPLCSAQSFLHKSVLSLKLYIYSRSVVRDDTNGLPPSRWAGSQFPACLLDRHRSPNSIFKLTTSQIIGAVTPVSNPHKIKLTYFWSGSGSLIRRRDVD